MNRYQVLRVVLHDCQPRIQKSHAIILTGPGAAKNGSVQSSHAGSWNVSIRVGYHDGIAIIIVATDLSAASGGNITVANNNTIC